MSLQNPPMPTPSQADQPDHAVSLPTPEGSASTSAARDGHYTQPPARVSGWAEPNDTPIIDAARVSMRDLHLNKPAWKATLVFLWLRLLRPILLVGSWMLMAIYTFHHFLVPTEQQDDERLLALYAAIVLIILLVMLLVAPLRWRLQKDEDEAGALPSPSTVDELATHAHVAPVRLSRWRSVRRIVAHHDKHGNLRHAQPAPAER